MLRAHGIGAHVGGHYLQGGVGELMVQGFAAVYVEDSEVLTARSLSMRMSVESSELPEQHASTFWLKCSSRYLVCPSCPARESFSKCPDDTTTSDGGSSINRGRALVLRPCSLAKFLFATGNHHQALANVANGLFRQRMLETGFGGRVFGDAGQHAFHHAQYALFFVQFGFAHDCTVP